MAEIANSSPIDWEMPETLARRTPARDRRGGAPEIDPDAVWAAAYRRQLPNVRRWACREYLEGFELLALPEKRIPGTEELDRRIRPRTGWTTVETPVRYSDAEPWYRHFAERRFLVTTYMRRMTELEFTPEPDMFHDIFGHLPFLTLPRYAALLEMFAEPFLWADVETRELIKRLAWFSTEFGLVRENGALKAFGAGLISSIGELESVMGGHVPVLEFTVENVASRDKAIWSHNRELFVFDSIESLAAELRRVFDRVGVAGAGVRER